VKPAPSLPAQPYVERQTLDEGRVYAPSTEATTISLTTENSAISKPSDLEEQMSASTRQPSTEITSVEHNVSPPSYIKTLSDQVITSEEDVITGRLPTVISSDALQGQDEVAVGQSVSPDGIDQQSQSDLASSVTSDLPSDLSNAEQPERLNLESLTELLERISLTPWRVNTYDEGQGQILWLQNGSHLDYNPSGELILGGENQDETRMRLSHVGIEV
jgi:hypothetical protein